jgi:hypothetical protein
MKISLVLLGSLAPLGLAAPTQTISLEWSPELAEFYSAVDNQIQKTRARGLTQQPPTCNLSNAVMPVAPTPLPSPEAGLILREVTIGRGVQVRGPQPPYHTLILILNLQNYTCANASAQSTPVAIGAIASLYNASCIAANYPNILSMLPAIALNFPAPPQPSGVLVPSNIELCGHHYFATTTTPVFDLNVSPDPAQQIGNVVGRKAANSTAPANATKGPNGKGNGAVAWLYLSATNATQGNVKAVYRINTAGGSPPETCENSPATFSVPYAAEYWFYSTP